MGRPILHPTFVALNRQSRSRDNLIQDKLPKQICTDILPKVEAGEMSLVDAMKQTGNADSTAKQQHEVFGSLQLHRLLRDEGGRSESMQRMGAQELRIADVAEFGLVGSIN